MVRRLSFAQRHEYEAEASEFRDIFAGNPFWEEEKDRYYDLGLQWDEEARRNGWNHLLTENLLNPRRASVQERANSGESVDLLEAAEEPEAAPQVQPYEFPDITGQSGNGVAGAAVRPYEYPRIVPQARLSRQQGLQQ